MYPLATGGEKGCCINLPLQWKPGMKVRLDWHESDYVKNHADQSRELEIPRYDKPADLYVVFYPNKEVELVVSAAEPGNPEWRGRSKQTPWEQCVETYGRKPCFLALPKMFDTESYKGFCRQVKADAVPKGSQYCEDLMLECMRDFEDQARCNSILWEEKK